MDTVKISALSSPIWDGKKNHPAGEPFDIDDEYGQPLIDTGKAQKVKVVMREVVEPEKQTAAHKPKRSTEPKDSNPNPVSGEE